MVCTGMPSSAIAARMISSSTGLCARSVSSIETSGIKLPAPFAFSTMRCTSPAFFTAARNFCAVCSSSSGVISKAWSAPASSMLPFSSGCFLTKLSISDAFAGWPMKSATSKVKKSHGARKRSTVAAVMWSASQKYGSFHPSAFTAASAAALTLEGSEPMMLCSRFDLFQTGTTSTPCSRTFTHACNCALAWWANRSPTPTEYLFSFNP